MIVTRVFCSGAFPQLPSLRLAVVRLSCFGLRGALPPKLSRCDSSQLSPLRLAVCLVVQRALLDADMLELIDRSACLVELVTVESLCSSRACAVSRN